MSPMPPSWVVAGPPKGARVSSLPAHAATVARWWRKVRDQVGIEYRLHDLRHFYASGLIAAGCDVVTVQRAPRAFICGNHLDHL